MSSLDRDPYEHAQSLGLQVVTPEADQIFIDLDDEADRAVMLEVIAMFGRNGYTLRVEKETESKSGKRHVYIRAGFPLTEIERVALQACLGSDRKREALSIMRTWHVTEGEYVGPVSTFFEVPGRAPVFEALREGLVF